MYSEHRNQSSRHARQCGALANLAGSSSEKKYSQNRSHGYTGDGKSNLKYLTPVARHHGDDNEDSSPA